MEKVVRIFADFAEEEEAEIHEDAEMTPEDRLKLLILLRDRQHPDAAQQRLARVCRVVKLASS